MESAAEAVSLIAPPFSPSFEKFAKRIHLESIPDAEAEAKALFDAAAEKLQPKAAFRTAFIDGKNTATSLWEVTIDGKTFRGKALKALSGVHRVFPYVATCGTEMETEDLSALDMLAPYWLEELKLQALACAREACVRSICETYRITKPMSLNPGSGNTDIWPVEEMHTLFSLFGIPEPAGVRLTESSLMIPNKTVAGLLFSSPEIDYDSCEYCDREHCPDRRRPYRESL